MPNPFRVVFPLYPRTTQLDFTGPFEVFARLPGAECVLASVDGHDVQADGGITFTNVRRLDTIEHAALLCVPGGFGTIETLENAEYLRQIRRLAATAQYVTSVCTGSLLLGAAGLLQGKRAACHWAWRDSLTAFGATPDSGRVVRDGNIITGGGVTAGIDMALTVMAEIAGIEHAKGVQLAMEYAPAPPFDTGRPENVGPTLLANMRTRMTTLASNREAAVRRAAAALDQTRAAEHSPALNA